MNLRQRGGFTIVEILVVITIIGILMAVLVPAVQMAREAARRAHCSNNLRQIGLAMLCYHNAFKVFPPGRITKGPWWDSKNWTCWPIELLPFLEQKPLFDLYDSRFLNDAPENAKFRETFVATYACPTDGNADRLEEPESGPGGLTMYRGGSYRGMGGRTNADGYWDIHDHENLPPEWAGVLHVVGVGGLQCERLGTIFDGASDTLMVGEYHTKTHTSRGTFWAYSYGCYNSSDASLDSRTMIPDFDECVAKGANRHTCKRGWGSFHPNGLNFLICDGSVHFVAQTIDMELFCRLATVRGGRSAQLPR